VNQAGLFLMKRTKNALLIMNPRNIPTVMSAFKALPIDKYWMRAYTERELAEGVISEIIEGSDYQNYLLCSDDVICTPEALAAVEELLERKEIASGWANMAVNSKNLCVTINPLRLTHKGNNGKPSPVVEDYDLLTVDEFNKLPEEFEATCSGFALMGARRSIWLRYPFQVYTRNSKDGYSSDHDWSFRIQDEHRIWITKKGYIENLKPSDKGICKDNWIRDSEPGRVIRETYENLIHG